MAASVTHKPKAGAQLTGPEYEAADSHDVSIAPDDLSGAFTSVPVGTVSLYTGSGDPESSQSAAAGSLYLRTNGSIYIKASGSGNTGWLEIITVD